MDSLATISITEIEGIGPKRAEVLSGLGIQTVNDLLTYVPRRYLDRSTIAPITTLPMGQEVTVIGRVVEAGFRKGKVTRFVVVLEDETGRLECVWFQGGQLFKRIIEIGDTLAVSGRIDSAFRGRGQMTHPEVEVIGDKEHLLHTGGVIPLYPLTSEARQGGISNRVLRRFIRRALDCYGERVEETLDGTIRQRYELLSRRHAFETI
ncbi:MAG: DNA helicase RecG, partial [Candidatus Latescibacteria bacterium]|nr:DNA helicase RecG [Candidatus Latescibacterota bacterium]